jgi:hypothetical protein
MFQYAAARVSAERIGCEHAINSPYLRGRQLVINLKTAKSPGPALLARANEVIE